MAYKLVCVHEFFDDISGKHISRGEEILDYQHMAKLVAANREHHFNKVYLVMAEGQWEWPPVIKEAPPEPTPEPETIAAQHVSEE